MVAGWDELPIDFDDPHVHDLHIARMERLLAEPIDAVFTGEAYGDLLAERWGVEHVLSAARRGDLRHRGARRPGRRAGPARRRRCARTCAGAWSITGAESTGTTTLARALAERSARVWVPEVGRAVSEARGIPYAWTDADFEDRPPPAGRRGPRGAGRRPGARLRHRRARHLRLAGALPGPLDRPGRGDRGRAHATRCTVLTGDDIPFVQDGLRDGEHLRGWMTERFRERLRDPWIEVRGSVAERVEQVLSALPGC